MTSAKSQFGMIGMAVMGKNLALNIADHGTTVAVYNREQHTLDAAVAGTSLTPTRTLRELVAALERPRRIMMMIKAGKPVDMVLDELAPLLDREDVVIDGGNSWFEDTRRREATLREKGLHFFGVGVSGGEEGARHGPSLMPGGDAKGYQVIRPVLESIAARTDSGACVTHVGPDGAGHFVKMVHNGIEYADMQCIAEAYQLLRDLGGLGPAELADVFARWGKGPLESFLIEITAKIFTVKDPKQGGFLVDKVLDKAGQKGTGKWTAQVALDLGVAIPSIAAAIDARVLSSMKDERVRAAEVLAGPKPVAPGADDRGLVEAIHDALYAAKIGAYAQGMALIAAGSRANQWGIDQKEMARIWKGGCIIRAKFLDTIMRAYGKDKDLPNLFLDEQIRRDLEAALPNYRRVVALAFQRGVPVPAMSAGLAYFDAYRSKSLPQNLTQAQRDAFGAHTYQRVDDPSGAAIHTEWLA